MTLGTQIVAGDLRGDTFFVHPCVSIAKMQAETGKYPDISEPLKRFVAPEIGGLTTCYESKDTKAPRLSAPLEALHLEREMGVFEDSLNRYPVWLATFWVRKADELNALSRDKLRVVFDFLVCNPLFNRLVESSESSWRNVDRLNSSRLSQQELLKHVRRLFEAWKYKLYPLLIAKKLAFMLDMSRVSFKKLLHRVVKKLDSMTQPGSPGHEESVTLMQDWRAAQAKCRATEEKLIVNALHLEVGQCPKNDAVEVAAAFRRASRWLRKLYPHPHRASIVGLNFGGRSLQRTDLSRFHVDAETLATFSSIDGVRGVHASVIDAALVIQEDKS